ncbi:hypothetical protein C8Q72DRAFT_501684 [Fomitopsis betulina]|nr:hypothetical protein C8Q72DRAFT_501684 [Fomitopsis betulina]
MISGPGAPDLELLWASVCFSVDDGIVMLLPETSSITMGAACLKVQSTENITLASKSIWDKPLMDANYFQSEHDVNVILLGTRFLLQMARTEPLASQPAMSRTRQTHFGRDMQPLTKSLMRTSRPGYDGTRSLPSTHATGIHSAYWQKLKEQRGRT